MRRLQDARDDGPVVDARLAWPAARQVRAERLPNLIRQPGDNEAREVVQHGGEVVPAPSRDLEVKSVCQSWLGAVVLSLNSSAALMTM